MSLVMMSGFMASVMIACFYRVRQLNTNKKPLQHQQYRYVIHDNGWHFDIKGFKKHVSATQNHHLKIIFITTQKCHNPELMKIASTKKIMPFWKPWFPPTIKGVLVCFFWCSNRGDLCGIVQMSSQILLFKCSTFTPSNNIFDKNLLFKYMKPPNEALWSHNAINIHFVSPDSQKFHHASKIDISINLCSFINNCVWPNKLPFSMLLWNVWISNVYWSNF